MSDGARGFIYSPLLNYVDGNLNFLEPVLQSDDCINSLSDGGAHCGTICDAASPTFMLQHWVRDREGFKLSLSQAIKRQCADTAKVYGLDDRGVLAPGYLADINIIELSYRFLLNNKALSEIVVGVKNKEQLDFALSSINKGSLPSSVFETIQNLLTNFGITSW